MVKDTGPNRKRIQACKKLAYFAPRKSLWMQSNAFLVTSVFSWFINFITRSLALRSVTMTRPAGWYWINCERSKQATARARGSLDVSKIVKRTLRIWERRLYVSIAKILYFFIQNDAERDDTDISRSHSIKLKQKKWKIKTTNTVHGEKNIPGNHFLQSLWYYHARIGDLCAWETSRDGQGGLLACTCRKNSIS